MNEITNRGGMQKDPLSAEELRRIDAWWRAANYLSVGQIYLLDNPLLREPLLLATRQVAAARSLGHDAGPQLHLRAPEPGHQRHDLDMIYLAGPGHGGPALVANTWLEGSYSEFYPNISQDAEGMERLFRQFSFPGGVPQPRRARNTGLHPRGRRTRLRRWRTPSARCSTIPI